jgi:ectoine hydroxylase-related dioxygenase (phytanoyl-CoA dioxygenase family)
MPVEVGPHAAEFDEQGFTILKDAIDPEMLDGLIGVIDRMEVDSGSARAPDYETKLERGVFAYLDGPNTVRMTGNIILRSPLIQRLTINASVLRLVEAVLGRECLLASMLTLVTGPGNPAQALHVDDVYLPVPRPHPALSMNAIYALTDFTEENGATRVVPGSHKWREAPAGSLADVAGAQNERSYTTVPAVMSRGSVLITHGSVIHGGGANLSGARRYGISALFCQGWVRPTENLQLGIPLDVLRTFDPRLQELIGVRGRFHGSHGRIGNMDPADVLFPI